MVVFCLCFLNYISHPFHLPTSFSKVLEKVMYKRVIVSLNNVLAEEQCGFRKALLAIKSSVHS